MGIGRMVRKSHRLRRYGPAYSRHAGTVRFRLEEVGVKKCLVPVVCSLSAFVAAGAPMAQAADRAVDGGLTTARAISDKYHDEAVAIADGFARTDHCIAEPHLGGMGYHYINGPRIDSYLQPGLPEVVLYKDTPQGRQLTGIEYIVVDKDQDLRTDQDRPELWGHKFDGPMPGHEEGMPVHYDLHVWAWHDNPSGAFTAWNPAITCAPPATP